jgi:hypothetical protein
MSEWLKDNKIPEYIEKHIETFDKESAIDFGVDDYEHVNEFYIGEHYSGQAKDCLLELVFAMSECEEIKNFNKSDS